MQCQFSKDLAKCSVISKVSDNLVKCSENLVSEVRLSKVQCQFSSYSAVTI